MILDTDVVIDILRKLPQADAWLNSQSKVPSISGMAALEALYGATDKSQLRNLETFLDRFPVLWPSEADLRATRRLARYHLSNGIELMDAVTAVLALRHNQPVATFNVKHFRAIPGLITVQPYSRA